MYELLRLLILSFDCIYVSIIPFFLLAAAGLLLFEPSTTRVCRESFVRLCGTPDTQKEKGLNSSTHRVNIR